jgi:DNA-directed RNA polymerase subunit RPC12/RpoP
MSEYTPIPDYDCPHCGAELEADWDDWENVEFEGETDIDCPKCEKRFRVCRSYIECYEVLEDVNE